MILWLLFAALTAAAVLVVLWPLMGTRAARGGASDADLHVYRDQLDEIGRDLERGIIGPAEAGAARAELGRRMIAAQARLGAADTEAGRPIALPAVTWGIIVAVPLLTLAVYLSFGAPHLPGQPLQARMEAPAEQQEIEVMVARVERHLAENPQDGQGWEVLAPVYQRLGRYNDSVRAWHNVIRYLGTTAERQAHYGEAMVLASDGIVTDEARDAFEASLAGAPDAAQPRFYMAIAAEQDGEWELAVTRWQELLARAPGDAPWREVAEERLADARHASGEAAPGLTADDVAAAAEMGDEERSSMIAGMVERLAERLSADGRDLDGWLRLAHAHAVLGDAEEARAALAGASRNFEGDAEAGARIEAAARELGLDS